MDCESRCKSKRHAQELNTAVTKASFEEAKAFIQRCHNFGKASDAFGRNLLHMAASCGREELLVWLLSTGRVDVNHKDKESGWTPLHRAIFYGQLSSAVALILAGASLTIKDNEGLTPLDLAMKDLWQFPFIQLTKAGLVKDGNADVYTWGDNSNFTLGHRSEQNRSSPDIVEFFSKNETSLKEVVMTKYHSIFLSLDGRVFLCGHGLGGRLGLGHEEAAFHPTRIGSLNNKCVAIAAGRDHSLFLMEGGDLYGCGLNEHLQLGDQADGSKKILVPRQLFAKGLKGKSASEQIVGICAGRYHSVFYTASSVFTVGLNAGQLGHLKNDAQDPCLKQPRVVSAVHQRGSNIKQVCSSDAAVVVLLNNGEIYLLHEYHCRKLTRYAGCVQVAVCGGVLDHRLDPSGVLCERGGGELIVCALGSTGQVFMWRESWQFFARLDWNIGRHITATHIAVGLYDLLLCTSEGEAFRVTLSNVKRDRVVDDKWDHFTVASARSATGAAAAAATAAASDTIGRRAADARARRISCVHRAIAVALDHKSTCFAVLQAQPVIENSFVMIPDSSFVEDYEMLHETADINDGLSDIYLQVAGESFPSHAYILASRSDYFRSIIFSKEIVRPLHLDMPAGVSAEVLRHVLGFLYSGQLDIAAAAAAVVSTASTEKTPSSGRLSIRPSSEQLLDPSASAIGRRVRDVGRTAPLLMGEGSSTVVDSAGCQVSFSSDPAEESRSKASRSRDGSGIVNGRRGNNGSMAAEHGLGALRDVARTFKVKDLLDRISNVVPHRGGFMVTKTPPRRLPVYRRDRLPQLHDVVLVSSDGKELPCHKCVLSARLEYFRTMFSVVWIQGSTDCSDGNVARLELPVPADILKTVVDYLYTDDLTFTDGARSPSAIDFLCSVLVVADQWLLLRLKAICEARLVSQLTYKSVWSLLSFAVVYNATSLAESCREFVSLNLSYTLEMLAQDSSGQSPAAAIGSSRRIADSESPDGCGVSGVDEDDSGIGDGFAAALRSVSTYYRSHLPSMSRRLITPYAHDSPSTEELERARADAAATGTVPSPSSAIASAATAIAVPAARGGRFPGDSVPAAATSATSSPSAKPSKAKRRERFVSASSSGCGSECDLSTSPISCNSAVTVGFATSSEQLRLQTQLPAVSESTDSVAVQKSTAHCRRQDAIPADAQQPSSIDAVAFALTSTNPTVQSTKQVSSTSTLHKRPPPRSIEADQLSDHIASVTSSLRDIMRAEEDAVATLVSSNSCHVGVGGVAHSNFDLSSRAVSGKSSKMSQKEKKKLAAARLSDASSQPGSAGNATNLSSASQQQQPQGAVNAWRVPAAAAVVSLRDVMSRQSESTSPSASSGRTRNERPDSAPEEATARPRTTTQSSKGQPVVASPALDSRLLSAVRKSARGKDGVWHLPVNSATHEDALVSPSESRPVPLQTAAAAVAVSPKPVSFQLIVDSELKLRESQLKRSKKPLSLIQIEEQAIAELYSHYRALASCDEERVTVERVSAIEAAASNGPYTGTLHSWAAHSSPHK